MFENLTQQERQALLADAEQEEAEAIRMFKAWGHRSDDSQKDAELTLLDSIERWIDLAETHRVKGNNEEFMLYRLGYIKLVELVIKMAEGDDGLPQDPDNPAGT